MLSLGLIGCASTALTGANLYYDRNQLAQRYDDFKLAHVIHNNLDSHATLKHQHLSVVSFNRTILLLGQVAKPQLKQQAYRIAKQTPNSRKIFNYITVAPNVSFVRRAADTWISTKLRVKFIATNQLNPSRLKVTTENAVVYLLGTVRKSQAHIAEYLAKRTNGVKKVVSLFEYIERKPIKQTVIVNNTLDAAHKARHVGASASRHVGASASRHIGASASRHDGKVPQET